MDFFELLEKRRSIRDFEDKMVPLDLIKEIINDTIKAPNAGNMQLWRFIVINNREWMKRLSDLNKKTILADIHENQASAYKVYEAILKQEAFNVFYNAPCVVYIVGTSRSATIGVDCALAAAYFMLASAARGLGTCWVAQGGEIRDAEVLKEIGLPENYRIVAPIVLGYPKGIPPMPERKEARILKIIS